MSRGDEVAEFRLFVYASDAGGGNIGSLARAAQRFDGEMLAEMFFVPFDEPVPVGANVRMTFVK